MWPGTQIYPEREGRVVRAERDRPNHPGFFAGSSVVVEHDDGTRATYAHLNGSTIPVAVGDHVSPSQTIGRSGLSGRTLYPHLHFQLTDSDGVPFASQFQDAPQPNLHLFAYVCAKERPM